MAFAGLRGSGSWGTDERPKNFREMILFLNPKGSAPLFALTSKIRKETVDDPEFSWWEESLGNIRLAVNFTTGFSTTDNTLTVDAGSATINGGLELVAGDVLMVEKAESVAYDNELMLVSSVTSDTVIVVKRGIAGTTAAPALDDVFLTKIGNAFEEGSGAPDVVLNNPTKVTNYCQIFKTAVGLTNTAKEIHARTGDAWTIDKKRKAFAHSRDIEWSLLFGRAYEDTGGTFPKRYTGGLRKFITTNSKIYTTTPTEDDLLDWITPLFNFDTEAGDERIVFAGNGFLNSLNKLARNSTSTRINFNGVLEVYGMKLQEWIIPQGRLGIKTHPLLNQHGRYSNSAFVVDPSLLIYRPLRNRDTSFKDNIQANDSDTRKGQWLTEAGLEVEHQKTMGYIGNFVV